MQDLETRHPNQDLERTARNVDALLRIKFKRESSTDALEFLDEVFTNPLFRFNSKTDEYLLENRPAFARRIKEFIERGQGFFENSYFTDGPRKSLILDIVKKQSQLPDYETKSSSSNLSKEIRPY